MFIVSQKKMGSELDRPLWEMVWLLAVAGFPKSERTNDEYVNDYSIHHFTICA